MTDFNSNDERYAGIAADRGMKNSLRALTEARALNPNVKPSIVVALLEQETSDGSNVWGHDPPPNGGTGSLGGEIVTEDDYKAYKRRRDAGGKGRGGMQGVGPLQLTWWEFQDRADAAGGCWIARCSIRVGIQIAGALIEELGERKGLAVYNGGASNPNYRYAEQVLAKADRWHDRFTD